MAKKTAKKYTLKRSDIAETLGDIRDRLGELDTFETSPSDVLNVIAEIMGELETLQNDVDSEAY